MDARSFAEWATTSVMPLVLVVAVVAVTGGEFAWRTAKSARAAAAAKAAPKPPPCGLTTHAKLTVHYSLRTIAFKGAEFSRQLGNVNCAWVLTRRYVGGRTYTVCQFSSPGGVEVKTARGVYAFDPGPGVPATITIVDGLPRCVASAENTTPKILAAARAQRRPFD